MIELHCIALKWSEQIETNCSALPCDLTGDILHLFARTRNAHVRFRYLILFCPIIPYAKKEALSAPLQYCSSTNCINFV